MISISSNLNIMIKTAEKASKTVIRDFGEIEKLQASKKGPRDFVTNSDKKVSDSIRAITLIRAYRRRIIIMNIFKRVSCIVIVVTTFSCNDPNVVGLELPGSARFTISND